MILLEYDEDWSIPELMMAEHAVCEMLRACRLLISVEGAIDIEEVAMMANSTVEVMPRTRVAMLRTVLQCLPPASVVSLRPVVMYSGTSRAS